MSETVKHTDMLERGMFLRDYRIDGYLASGGFGNTYRVTHMQLQESFAIKEFFMKGVSERGDDSTSVRISNVQNRNQFESQLRKFKKEALRLRQMHNEHIVRVHDLFEANGTAYYVMDLIDGESLAARLRRHGRPMTEAEVSEILHQLLDALEAVHTAGFQHLDLKPANVMIDRYGQITLIDFGASKQLDSEDGASTSSVMAYTPGYAPREQVEQNISKLGPWTDLYALGATLYNLLTTHKPPLTSDIDDEGERAFDFQGTVSPEMRNLILWMMTPRREQRPQSVADVRKRLAMTMTSDEVTVVEPQLLRPVPSPKTTPELMSEKPSKPAPSPRSHPDDASPSRWNSKLIAIIAAVVVIGAALIWWGVNRGDESTRAETAVTDDNNGSHLFEFETLTTELDTLTYAIGMSQSAGLKEYLSTRMEVDTTYMTEFNAGLLYGTGLQDSTAQNLKGEARKAYIAGIQIGEQVSNGMVKNINEMLFGSNTNKTISLKTLMMGFMDAINNRFWCFNMEQANEYVQVNMEKYKNDRALQEYGSNKDAGEKYMARIAKKDGIKRLGNGVFYEILTEGRGKVPTETDRVRVRYEGTLIDGTVFDSNMDSDPAVFSANQVIPGFKAAIIAMPVGSKWKVYIPQDQAYGAQDMGEIKPYSAIVFTIELLGIER